LDLPQGLDLIPREIRTAKPPREKLSQDTANPTQQFQKAKTLLSKFWNQTLTQQNLEPNPHTIDLPEKRGTAASSVTSLRCRDL
jgi:hypothetical protein